jgi:DNA ligase-4
MDDDLCSTTKIKAKETEETFAAKVPFSALCDTFERISKEKGTQKKTTQLSLFLKRYLENYFPVMRLVLPHVFLILDFTHQLFSFLSKLDKERTNFGMKELNIAKFYVEILNISPNSDDGFRLLNWKNPTGSAVYLLFLKIFNVYYFSFSSKETGDFGSAIFLSVMSRCPIKGNLSIADVNHFLDMLNSSTDR